MRLGRRNTTPFEITSTILSFIKNDIGISAMPKFVDVNPIYPYGRCFQNVEIHVKEFSGSVQTGWVIWLAPMVLLEAEAHSVWRQPNGILIDITSKPDRERRILFVADDRVVYDGKHMPNICRILSKDKLIISGMKKNIAKREMESNILNKSRRSLVKK